MNYHQIKLMIVSIMVLLLCACAQQTLFSSVESISYQNEKFTAQPVLVTEEELLYLTDRQKKDFFEYFNNPVNADVEPYMRMYDYLESILFDFNYKATTLTADKTISLGEGNCMSLALLTTALARQAGVSINYQLIDSSPVFEKKDDVILRGVHVRTQLIREESSEDKKRKKDIFTNNKSGLIVDYFPGGSRRFLGNISHEEFIARYYQNLAADSLQENDYSLAYWNILKALEYAPKDHAAINTMAVIHRRIGDEIKAEEIYKYGITHSREKLTLLKNYKYLLSSQGRTEEADKINKMILEFDEISPYNWVNIASIAYKNKEYLEAITYYKKAVAIAPYLQDAYLGLAKTYHALGKLEKTKNMLLLALENNNHRENYPLIKAKMMALSKNGELNLDVR